MLLLEVFRSNVRFVAHSYAAVVRRYSRICLSGRTDGEECAAAFSSLSLVSLLLSSIRSYCFDRFLFFLFFFLSFYDPSFRKGIDRLVGNLLKIGSLLFSHRRSSWNAHEHPRSIKSPLANGTRRIRERGDFFLKKDETDIVSKIYDRSISPLHPVYLLKRSCHVRTTTRGRRRQLAERS